MPVCWKPIPRAFPSQCSVPCLQFPINNILEEILQQHDRFTHKLTSRHPEQNNPDTVESHGLVWKASHRTMDGNLLQERREVIECQHAALHEESHRLAGREGRNAARASDHSRCVWKADYGRPHTGNIVWSRPSRAGRLLFSDVVRKLSGAFLTVLQRQLKRYLEGDLSQLPQDVIDKTASAPSHNMYAEGVLGMTDVQKRRSPISAKSGVS